MINLNFWTMVRDRWIKDSDPTIHSTETLVTRGGMTATEIEDLINQLDGDLPNMSDINSLDDVSSMMDRLGELGMDDIPFDLFQ